MTGGPWYNTSICKKLNGKVFEGFIRNARTDRYNIMCSIDAHLKLIHQNMMMEAAVVFIHYHHIYNRSIRVDQCNHIFHWLLAKSLRKQFSRALSCVYFCYEPVEIP